MWITICAILLILMHFTGICKHSFAYIRSYPQLLEEAPDDPVQPLQLLAWRLEFVDPLSGVERRFESARALPCRPAGELAE